MITDANEKRKKNPNRTHVKRKVTVSFSFERLNRSLKLTEFISIGILNRKNHIIKLFAAYTGKFEKKKQKIKKKLISNGLI